MTAVVRHDVRSTFRQSDVRHVPLNNYFAEVAASVSCLFYESNNTEGQSKRSIAAGIIRADIRVTRNGGVSRRLGDSKVITQDTCANRGDGGD